MYDLESEWPAHNQGKTPGWLAGEKPNRITYIQKHYRYNQTLYKNKGNKNIEKN